MPRRGLWACLWTVHVARVRGLPGSNKTVHSFSRSVQALSWVPQGKHRTEQTGACICAPELPAMMNMLSLGAVQH